MGAKQPVRFPSNGTAPGRDAVLAQMFRYDGYRRPGRGRVRHGRPGRPASDLEPREPMPGRVPVADDGGSGLVERLGPITDPTTLDPTLGLSLGHRRWVFRREGEEHAFALLGRVHSNSGKMLIQAAVDGLGLVQLPGTTGGTRSGLVPFYTCWRRGRRRSPSSSSSYIRNGGCRSESARRSTSWSTRCVPCRRAEAGRNASSDPPIPQCSTALVQHREAALVPHRIGRRNVAGSIEHGHLFLRETPSDRTDVLDQLLLIARADHDV